VRFAFFLAALFTGVLLTGFSSLLNMFDSANNAIPVNKIGPNADKKPFSP